MGDYGRAEPLYKRSLNIREKALGPEHPKVAQSLNNLAGIYKALGDYARAEPLYKRSLAINEKALGLEHSAVTANLDIDHDNGPSSFANTGRTDDPNLHDVRSSPVRLVLSYLL